MKVIDLSAWQESVDWEAVKAAGVEGVILKLGERDQLDGMFIRHVNNAVANDLAYGVYYYAHATGSAEARHEAEQADAWIKEYLRGENPRLGIWYDAEDSGMLAGDVTASCSAFVADLNDRGYDYVGIYSSYNWLTSGVIDTSRLADYVPYWVAQYNSANSFKAEYPNKRVRIWQYTDHFSDTLPYDCNIYYK